MESMLSRQPTTIATGIYGLVDQIGALYLSEEMSDVTIVVEGVKLPAHRLILAQRCDYFKTMFNSGLIESTSNRIEVHETSVDVFKCVLKWIYTGSVEILSVEHAFEVLHLAHMYQITELVEKTANYLKGHLTIDNVFSILNIAVLLSLDELKTASTALAAANSIEIYRHNGFHKLSSDALIEMLQSASAPEIDVFTAVVIWMKMNQEKSADFVEVLKCTPLSAFSPDELAIVPNELVDSDVLHDIALEQRRKKNIPEYQQINENVAIPRHGVKVISGGNPTFFTTGMGILKHPVGSDEGIVIDLGRHFRLNLLRMQLVETGGKSASYWVLVSTDNVNYTRVIDHLEYTCRSLQNLYFEPRLVRYIRICGTASSGLFEISRFEAFCTNEKFVIDPETTLQIPTDNVALAQRGAIVINGTSHPENAIINGTLQGFTSNGFNDGIIVQLPQPYLIDCIRLLLWDSHSRVYSYKLEVSTNLETWTPIHKEARVANWREINFPRQPVVFIKIIVKIVTS
uniref:BTB domain-containing protein n=1 Tax=Panagrellus redivivus TaxID=6233 RepID=A0A7E4V4A0_PANRE